MKQYNDGIIMRIHAKRAYKLFKEGRTLYCLSAKEDPSNDESVFEEIDKEGGTWEAFQRFFDLYGHAPYIKYYSTIGTNKPPRIVSLIVGNQIHIDD